MCNEFAKVLDKTKEIIKSSITESIKEKLVIIKE